MKREKARLFLHDGGKEDLKKGNLGKRVNQGRIQNDLTTGRTGKGRDLSRKERLAREKGGNRNATRTIVRLFWIPPKENREERTAGIRSDNIHKKRSPKRIQGLEPNIEERIPPRGKRGFTQRN